MKLYATTTSERASKGQGGNKYLNVFINIDERRSDRFRLFITCHDDETITLALADMDKPFPNTVWSETIRGEKQKGELQQQNARDVDGQGLEIA